MSEPKQETATIFQDDTVVLGRNPEGRVLFRHNRIDGSFGAFRSKRMTGDEKRLLSVMLGRCVKFDSQQEADDANERLMAFLDYKTESDVFCA